MTRYIGFGALHRNVIVADVYAAKLLAQRCENALAFAPAGPSLKIQQLLWDTFSIPVRGWDSEENWEKTGNLRMRFGCFGTRMERAITLKYSAEGPSNPAEMDYAAFVTSNQWNTINVGNRYFATKAQRGRAAILIHEFIHTLDGQTGHPGGVRLFLSGQDHVGIPFEMAFNNGYCYQYFAEWM